MTATMWDDGLTGDLRLIEILRKIGATAAFALSPSRHGKFRSVNDLRGDYGTLVSKSELKEFASFEICNHTDTHVDLGKVDADTTRREIVGGRRRLEDIFGRPIQGFCYPYGVYTDHALTVLREEDVLYGRTTKPGRPENHLLLHPTGRWSDVDVESLANTATGSLILWGHTYELHNEGDWHKVKALYTLLTQHPRIKLVSFEELVKNVKTDLALQAF